MKIVKRFAANNETPVLVLSASHHGALGINRSLGRLGVPVYNVTHDRWSPAIYSRYSKGKFLLDLTGLRLEEVVDTLVRIGEGLSRSAILIPTCDRTAGFVADCADTLAKYFLFPRQPAGLVRSLSNKKSMYYLCQSLGVPTAKTAFPQSKSEVIALLESARFPIMLKSIGTGSISNARFTKNIIVRDERELLSLYSEFENPEQPNLMLQEYIPGGEDSVWMFNGYFDAQSECLIGATGQKIRQCPVYTGPTCLGICVENRVVENTTKSFMKAVGYRGILDIGYRFDARDGFYKVLDVNPRVGSTFRLFADNSGMDVVRALYLDLTGQPVHAGVVRAGRKWIVEDWDIVSSVRYYCDRRLGVGEWVRSFGDVEETALFARDDLRPVAARVLQDAFGMGAKWKARSGAKSPGSPGGNPANSKSECDAAEPAAVQ